MDLYATTEFESEWRQLLGMVKEECQPVLNYPPSESWVNKDLSIIPSPKEVETLEQAYRRHRISMEDPIIGTKPVIGAGSMSDAYWDYDFTGRTYRIYRPVSLTVVGNTHQVVDAEGVTHCVPAPGFHGCVVRKKAPSVLA